MTTKGIEIVVVKRPWGNFRQFTRNVPSTVKILTVKAGEELSLQNHKKRSEFWHVVHGDGIIQVGKRKKNVGEGNEFYIPEGEMHRLIAGSSGIIVLEIAMGEFDENDIIRYEDKYGRV